MSRDRATKQRAHLRVHREIRVPLAIALLRIGEPGVTHRHAIDDLFLAIRQRTKRLRQHLHGRHANRDLARARAHERPRHADDVADVVQIELRTALVAQLVLAEVELDAPTAVGEMRERRLAMPAPRDERPATRTVARLRAADERRHRLVASCVRSKPYANGGTPAATSVELLAPRLLHEVQLVGHAALPVVTDTPPDCLRNASMNGSMPPSITFWTSGIFSSVRWSLTMVYGWNT